MRSIKEEAKRFCQTTSIKGVPRIMRSQSTLLCLIWTLAVISFLSVALYQTVYLVINYFQYSTITIVKEKSIDLSSAPDIAICNSHPLSSLSEEAKNNMSSLREFHWHLNALTNCSNCSTAEMKLRKNMQQRLSSPYGYYQFIGKEAAKAASHLESDILVDCSLVVLRGSSFEHVPCDGRVEISHHMTINNFNCYKVHALVPTYGYSFISYIDYTYMDDIDSGELDFESDINTNTGLVIYLVESQTLWSSITMQTWLSPGTFNNIQFLAQKKESLGPPYGSCKTYDMERYNMSYKMSFAPCINLCKEREIAKACKCRDPTTLSYLDNIGLVSEMPYCANVSSSAEMIVKYKSCADKNAREKARQCISSCPTSCSYMRYTPSVTSSPWPSHRSLRSFYKAYIEGHRYETHFKSAWQQMLNGSKQPFNDLVRENFVKYQIVPANFRYLHIKDQPQVTLVNLLSQLGGILNLWCGITVFITIEIVEFIIRMLGNDKHSQTVQPNKLKIKECGDPFSKKT